jgi:hypothetical protein
MTETQRRPFRFCTFCGRRFPQPHVRTFRCKNRTKCRRRVQALARH